MFSLQEPYQILNEIHEIASHWSTQFDETSDMSRLYFLFFMFPKMKVAEFENRVEQMKSRLKKPLFVSDLDTNLGSFYSTLINCETKYSKQLNDLFWLRIGDYLTQYPSSWCRQKLIWISLRYVYTSSNGEWRNFKNLFANKKYLVTSLLNLRNFSENFFKMSLISSHILQNFLPVFFKIFRKSFLKFLRYVSEI